METHHAEDDDDDESVGVLSHIVTVEEMLATGLKLFYKDDRVGRAKNQTNKDRFVKTYGVAPLSP